MNALPHRGLDHLAIVVPDTDAALALWRDRLGFPVLVSEVVQDGAIRLTHLDLGNTQLQLVQPLRAEHPLQDWLRAHGSGLHHFCLRVDDVDEIRPALALAGVRAAPQPHQGTQGKRALFATRDDTLGALLEFTGR